MAVGTSRRVVPHLLGTVHGTLVRRNAPTIPAVHGPVLDILVAACVGALVGVERIADLADGFDDMAGIGRCGAASEKVVVCLALVRLELLELGAVGEFGAHGGGGCGRDQRRDDQPHNHGQNL